MTSFPSSAGGPYGLREIRSLYPAVTENHLRYLEKWGLLRQAGVPRDVREFSFSDLLTIKQVAAELERGTPLRVILRALLAERQGQLQLDFVSGHAASDAPRAKVVTLEAAQAQPERHDVRAVSGRPDRRPRSAVRRPRRRRSTSSKDRSSTMVMNGRWRRRPSLTASRS